MSSVRQGGSRRQTDRVNVYDSQEVYTWVAPLRELICPNLVCMCVCHAQKMAKLFFSVRSTQFPFKPSILGPKRLLYFFLNTLFNLKGNCVFRTLKNSFAIF